LVPNILGARKGYCDGPGEKSKEQGGQGGGTRKKVSISVHGGLLTRSKKHKTSTMCALRRTLTNLLER